MGSLFQDLPDFAYLFTGPGTSRPQTLVTHEEHETDSLDTAAATSFGILKVLLSVK